jgi:lycopene cyclase domain-containing protein
VSHLAYLGVLAGCLAGTGWLELRLHTGVYRRWRRLVLSIAPVLVVFTIWDLYAIAHGHWTFDPKRTTGLLLPGHLPVEELAFFVVIPVCSVLAFEAVRCVRHWPVGDEPSPTSASVDSDL